MRLKELLKKMNDSLKLLDGKKFNNIEEFSKIIIEPLIGINTGMNDLIRLDAHEVRLIKEDEINISGSVGNVLFKLVREVELDKRVKNGYKGKIISIKALLDENLPEEILMSNLSELQSYFDEVKIMKNILWHEEQIDLLQEQINKHRAELKQLNQSK